MQYLDSLVVRFDQGLRFPSTEYVQAQILQEMNSGEIQDASRKNWSSGFLTRPDINRAVQSQKMARDVKFRI